MMNSNKKTNKYVMVIICITFTLSMFYLSTKAVIYILNKRDVEGFAESILERSVLLMEQIEFVESKSKSVNESAACTKEHIKKLREILWPQRFIKDIAYANQDTLLCTALWGDDLAPEKLNNNYNSVKYGKGFWLLDVKPGILGGNNIYVINNLAIIPSPFMFARFSLDSTNKK